MSELVILIALAGTAALGFGLRRMWAAFCALHDAALNERAALDRSPSGADERLWKPPAPPADAMRRAAIDDLRRHRATAAAPPQIPAGCRGPRSGRTRA